MYKIEYNIKDSKSFIDEFPDELEDNYIEKFYQIEDNYIGLPSTQENFHKYEEEIKSLISYYTRETGKHFTLPRSKILWINNDLY